MPTNRWLWIATLLWTVGIPTFGADWPKATGVERQPLQASIQRLIEALRGTGLRWTKKPSSDCKLFKIPKTIVESFRKFRNCSIHTV